MKRKQFAKGMTEIAQEGAIQIFFYPNSGMERVVVGVIGMLQFDVLKFRMQSEYGVEYLRRDIPHELIRRVQNPDFDAADYNFTGDTRWVKDVRGRDLLIFNGAWTVRGPLAPHKELDSTPFRHFGLRVVSFLFGKSVIGLLKNVLIFKKTKSPYAFERTISVADGAVRIEDRIDGLSGAETVLPAPRASKRHVASADSFHPEDAALARGFSVARETRTEGGSFLATTTLSPRQ